MAILKRYELARVYTATTGTGTITLGAAVPGYLTFAQAGVQNGDLIPYCVRDGVNSEVGSGTYTTAGTTLSRTVIKSTNSDAAITLSGGAEVFIGPRAADFGTGANQALVLDDTGKIPVAVFSSAPSVGAGRLIWASTTTLNYLPYNGDCIKINGTFYVIPTTGVAGLATTAVFLNGTAAQPLVANTTYYIYAFLNSGVITADFRTGTYATSSTAGNVGVVILSGDNTRTLIGMVRTSAATQFVDTAAQRFVASWFNATTRRLLGAAVSGITTTSTTLVELSTGKRVEWVKFTGRPLLVMFSCNASNNTANYASQTAIRLDTGDQSYALSTYAHAAGYGQPMTSVINVPDLADGYHYAMPMGASPNGAGSIATLNGWLEGEVE